MRLYKEGYLSMPEIVFLREKEGSSIYGYYNTPSLPLVGKVIYSLKESELSEINLFLQNMKLPFKGLPLKLAHDNYEESYEIHQNHLSFLSLMISLESLFNPSGEGELRYRISRNTAVLIGKDGNDSQSIWKKMKELYDKRSSVVHSGNPNLISDDDLLILRDYVRRSIKEFYKIGKGKEEILNMLNSLGFGDRSWLKEKS